MASQKENLRVAIYTRVSTNTQAKENLSLEDQKRTLINWAKENGHEIVHVFEDAGASAFKGVRPEYKEMMSGIESGSIDVDCIAVYDASRFSRNEAMRYDAEAILEKNGVKLFSFMDCIPEDSDDAFLYKGFNGLFSESFSRKNSKKSAHKLNEAAKQGYFTGGKPPFGYTSVPVPSPSGGKQRKQLEVHVENGEIVNTIFSLALSGSNGISYGVKKIATYLNEKNITKN